MERLTAFAPSTRTGPANRRWHNDYVSDPTIWLLPIASPILSEARPTLTKHLKLPKRVARRISTMIIDGEKFACATCIRGHRTSQCQHSGKKSRLVGFLETRIFTHDAARPATPASQCQRSPCFAVQPLSLAAPVPLRSYQVRMCSCCSEGQHGHK